MDIQRTPSARLCDEYILLSSIMSTLPRHRHYQSTTLSPTSFTHRMSFRPPRPSRRFRSLFLLTLSLIGLIYWASPDQLSLQTIPFPFRPLQTPLSNPTPRPDILDLGSIYDEVDISTEYDDEPVIPADPCESWVHLDPESLDPPGCKRARMYRQVERLRVDETGLLFNMT